MLLDQSNSYGKDQPLSACLIQKFENASCRHQPQDCSSLPSSVEDYPKGFPQISCFLDSDDAFMVYRRFGCVYSRLLLSKQDEMSKMEAQLLTMDKTDQADNNGRYLMSRSLDVDREEIPQWWDGQSRCQLLGKLEKLALEYGEYFQIQIWPFWPGIFAKSFQNSFQYYRNIITL